jgi:hypothetical protein
LPTATDQIYQLPPDLDFEGDREVFMEGRCEHPVEITIEEITREAEEELTQVA